MNKKDPNIVEFHEDLSDSDVGTLSLENLYLVKNNKGTLHPCKKGAKGVRFMCQRKSVNTRYGTSNLELMTAEEIVSSDRLCKNCRYKIERETGLTQVTIALPEEKVDDILYRIGEMLDG